MPTKTAGSRLSPLRSAPPHATFSSGNHRIIEAPVDVVWDTLHTMRWGDLTLTRPLLWVRALGRAEGTMLDLGHRLMEAPGPAEPIHEEPPRYSTSAMVGKPWLPWAPHVEVSDLADVAAYAEPGWLKYGMEWHLSPLPGQRTLVETATVCDATDSSARRAFGLYWGLIRVFSGLVREDILAALARASTPSTAEQAA